MNFFNIFKKNNNIQEYINQIEYLKYKQLYEEKLLKEQVMSVLIDISNMIVCDALDMKIIHNVIQTILKITQSDEVYYSKYDKTTFKRIISYVQEDSEYESKIYEENELYDFTDTLMSHECFIINNNEFILEEKEIFNDANVKSICCCPVVIDGQLEGILGFQTKEEITWSDDSIGLCQIMASLVATYIQKEKLIKDLKNSKQDIEKACQAIETTVDLIDGYMWHKDAEGKYLYCTPSWKTLFFGLESNTDITGKTDIELLNDFRTRTLSEHTYGNICVGTDEHCKNLKKTCYYIEVGYINKKLFILEVTKTPHFDSKGKYIGIVGIAKDRSKDKNIIELTLSEYLKNNIAENLNPDRMFNEGVTAYWIKSKKANQQFNKISGILPRS